MPNIKSAKKRVLVAKKKNMMNASQKSQMRNVIRQFKSAVETQADNTQELLVSAISSIDKAAKKNLIHKANANRKKSRLQKMLNSH